MENMEMLVVGAVVLGTCWLSWVILKFLFVLARRIFGWLGPFLVSVAPAFANYVLLQALGIPLLKATFGGFVTSLLLGLMFQKGEDWS